MKKQLNIKTLAKGMRVQDKAKLLFADRNKRAETSGREGLLTSEEEKAIIDDAQNLHQISELNRLNKLFNVSSLIFLDIQTAYLHFRLAEGRVVTILTGMTLVGRASDVLSQVIYDLASQGYSDKQLEKHEFQKKVDQKATELNKKYKIKGGLADIYDYFKPSSRDGSYFSTEIKTKSEPNPLLQKAFIQTIREVKAFKKQVYQCDHVAQKAEMELLSDREKEIIKGFKKEIDNLINLEGHLGLVKMYGAFADKGFIRTTKLSEPKFLETVKNMEKATQLTREEKEKATVEIDELLERQVEI